MFKYLFGRGNLTSVIFETTPLLLKKYTSFAPATK